MSRSVKIDDLPWEKVRPGIAKDVSARTMLDAGTRVVYTRVDPGGGFLRHVDSYGHLLYILRGSGIAQAGGRDYQLEPGVVVQIEAGEEHSYTNTGSETLELISLNLPVSS